MRELVQQRTSKLPKTGRSRLSPLFSRPEHPAGFPAPSLSSRRTPHEYRHAGVSQHPAPPPQSYISWILRRGQPLAKPSGRFPPDNARESPSRGGLGRYLLKVQKRRRDAPVCSYHHRGARFSNELCSDRCREHGYCGALGIAQGMRYAPQRGSCARMAGAQVRE